MKITEIIYKEKDEYNDDDINDFRVQVCVKPEIADGITVSFGQGEPEDMSLDRDLSDAYSIFDLAIMAYVAGKNGEKLEMERLEDIEE